MLRIDARQFLKYTSEQLWDLRDTGMLGGEFILVFEDGQITTNAKEVIYSSYAWYYHRVYPDTPILKCHHVKDIIGDKRLSSDTHLKLIGNVLWSVYDVYKFVGEDKVKLLDTLAKMAYEITNHLYNELTYRLEEYVTSIDILDFIDVVEHPTMKKIMHELQPTQESITEAYVQIKDALNNSPSFELNQLAKAVRSGIVDINQVVQCVGPRGLLTDIDSHQFSKPVMRGYVHGIRSLHDSMVESRSAAKSLAFSTDPLQKSEYFSRRQQLICQNLKHLHMCDCGSTHYLDWHVRDAQFDGNVKISDSDLKTIAGKYYLDETTKTLKIVKQSDTHLLGKTIKLRSFLAGCMHPDPYGICEICFGETALAIPENTNIGHAACVYMTEKISQIVLSTKHLDNSAVIEGIRLKPFEKKFLSSQINGNVYFLNEDLKHKDVKLIINASKAMGLTDINLVDSIEKLNISRVSEFDEIVLMTTDAKGTDTTPLTVSVNKRLANMTHCLLSHVKQYGWSIAKDGKYVIDMANWDYSLPILSLPMRHFSMGDHQSKF